ncbi:putative dehydrogenase [Sedimentibacter acidaminivorans]|uniref:Dehydrogenase n=1 Tax=Sedimentibacter acidaminivorans TaxID=913099 RepID=A0ABS4GAX6_9FIRM|nr:putative dehydrogenase [Sedimentibacter acidaminivorans]
MKIIIVGTGVMGITHANAIKDSEILSLVGFVGRNFEKTKKIAESFSTNAYTDIEEMLSKEDVDILDICLPTYLHEYAVSMAIKYKKHIMCEKPFTLSCSLAERLSNKAKNAGIRMMVLQVVRFWPEYVSIKNMIDKKVIGEIQNIYMNRLSTYPKYSSWFRDPSKSGGGLYDLNIHDLDYLYYLFGEVKSVYATGQKSSKNSYDAVTANIVFVRGITATVECNMDIKGEYPFTTCVRVIGELGALEYNSTSRYDDNFDNVKYNELILYLEDKKPNKIGVTQYNPYQKQMEYFARCVLQDKDPEIINMNDVVYVLKMIKAIEKSLETNNVVFDI